MPSPLVESPTNWKKGAEVKCPRQHTVPASEFIEHGVPVCRSHVGESRASCGLCLYVVVLSRSPLLFAWADITLSQRQYILDNNLTTLQALWYLRLPLPMEQSA
jgi:hypothetical protein